MSILITGFDPFDDVINASQVLVESLQADLPGTLGRLSGELHFSVLPTDTHRCWPQLQQLLEQLQPDYCLLTGQGRGRDRISLERIAINLKDFERPDAAGNQPRGEHIDTAGPAAYWSTLPSQHRLIAALTGAGIPAAQSSHAGTHLCNQTLYQSLHYVRAQGLALRCGFVHVPLLPVQAQGRPHLTLDTARNAMAILVEALLESAGRPGLSR